MCLKYTDIVFTFPVEEEVTRIVNNGKEITKNISYILQFSGSNSSLSNLINKLSEGIHRLKYKFRHDDKKYKTHEIKYKYCGCFFEFKYFEDDLAEYKRVCCNKNYQQKFDEKLKERFFNTYSFSNFIVEKRCLSL